MVNGHLKTDELETGQRKVPSGLTVRDSPVNSPLKMMKTPPPPTDNSKMKIYKCGFCTFQSKELGHVRFVSNQSYYQCSSFINYNLLSVSICVVI